MDNATGFEVDVIVYMTVIQYRFTLNVACFHEIGTYLMHMWIIIIVIYDNINFLLTCIAIKFPSYGSFNVGS